MMTNREWLDTLSDEEFLQAINDMYDCGDCDKFWECDRSWCKEKLLAWLAEDAVEYEEQNNR